MSLLKSAQPARHSNPTCKAQRLAHLIFERPDLDQAEAFLNGFGLKTLQKSADQLFLRGAFAAPWCYQVRRGPKARFIALGLEVGSKQDLVELAKLPEASAVLPLDTPGGGFVVRLTDPSGFQVEAVYGQEPLPALPLRDPITCNAPQNSARINAGQRPPLSPPEATKLGHMVLEVTKFQATAGWYTQHFGLIPSDIQVLPDGSPAVCFFRLDLGDTPADHHTLAMAQSVMPKFSHCAFELVDQDAIGIGARVLREQGFKHIWGMGRHIEGSQIFDYWADPWKTKHEHYCDGDLFTADVPANIIRIEDAAIFQWGGPPPKDFLRPDISLKTLAALIKNLVSSPDLSVGKLLTMARLMT